MLTLSKLVKGLAVTALLTGTTYAATGTIQGTIPAQSFIVVSSEKYLDFSAPAEERTIATISVTSNTPEWAIKLSFDQANFDFHDGTTTQSMLQSIGLSGDNTNGYAYSLDYSVDNLAFAGNAAVVYDLITGAANVTSGDMSCGITGAGAGFALNAAAAITCAGGTAYAINNPIYVGGKSGAAVWVGTAQASTTDNWDLDVVASWPISTLLAGTYRSVMTVVLETNI
ncbi:MAG: hypothetical protein OCD01_15815 [Fibrobacterales bacterium]